MRQARHDLQVGGRDEAEQRNGLLEIFLRGRVVFVGSGDDLVRALVLLLEVGEQLRVKRDGRAARVRRVG